MLKGYCNATPKVWKFLNTKLVSNRRELLGKLMHLTTWVCSVHLSPESFANCHIIQEVVLQNI